MIPARGKHILDQGRSHGAAARLRASLAVGHGHKGARVAALVQLGLGGDIPAADGPDGVVEANVVAGAGQQHVGLDGEGAQGEEDDAAGSHFWLGCCCVYSAK